MGLNFIIACHGCREQHYMMRGDEPADLQEFWRKHWSCSERNPKLLELFCDKDDYPEYANPWLEAAIAESDA